MKKTFVLLSILVIGLSTYAQPTAKKEFKGKWILPGGRDNSITLNFMDSNKVYFALDNLNKRNGHYKYRIGKINSDFVIMLWPHDKIRKDSIQLSITNLTEDSFQLKSIMYYYTDGRPPESELYEDQTYILRKVKNN